MQQTYGMDYRYPGGTLRQDCNTINYTNGKYIFKFYTIHNTMHNGRVQIYVIVTVRRYTFTVSLFRDLQFYVA